MAISDTSKIDLLYKKLFGVTKTDTATNKSPSNEAIASPALIRGDRVWTQSGNIPAVAADVTNIVQGYLTTARVECTADTTAAPISSVYPSWKTNLVDWIPPEFGSTYLVKVYVDTAGAPDPTSTGTQLSDAGSGGTGEWYFDYQSGVLNFIGGTIPAALTVSKVIFITGYRYIGSTGVLASGATANAAVFAITANTANTVLSISNFTTANLAEGVNLYYTNSRVRSAISAGTGVIYNSGTGALSIGQNVSTVADVTFNSVTVTGNLFISGNASYINSNSLIINDPIIQLGYGNPGDNFDLGFIGHYYSGGEQRHTGLFRDHTDGKFRLFDNLTAEPGLNDIDTANATFRYASIVASTFEGNVTGTVGSLSNFTTSNLAEGSNLYFTSARVLANVELMSINVLADVDITDIANEGVLRWNGTKFVAGTVGAASSSSFANTAGSSNVSLLANRANLVSSLSNHDTSNLAEGTNLYFTNARVLANVSEMSINVLADVDLTGISTDGILQWNGTKFIAATVAAAGAANIAGYAQLAGTANVALFAETSNVANTVLSLSNFTTANLAEGVNLYYTNARVLSAINPRLTTANIDEAPNFVGYVNQYFTNVRVLQAVTPLLTAANIANFDSRVVSTTTPLLTTGNVVETTNQYFTNARVMANVEQMSVNVFTDVDISGIQVDGYLLWNGTKFVPGSLANKLTTANVVELTNLYFTNARAVTAIQGADATMGNVTTTGLLKVSSGVGYENISGIEFSSNPAGGTGDVARIQYFSTESGDDTILEISVANNPGDSINIRTSPYGGGVGINVQRPTADFDADANTLIRKSLTVGGLTTGTTARYTGFLYANGLVINGTELVNGESGTSSITATRITANIWNGLYTANVIESPTNLYFTNVRVAPALLGQDVDLKNLTVQGNLIVQGDTTTLNVSQLSVEDKIITIASGATNSATADNSGIEIAGAGARLIYYVIGDKLLFNKNVDVDGTLSANSWGKLYTSNVVETTNQYFTNVRVLQAVDPKLTTANVTELTNLYFTNARVLVGITTGTVQGNITLTEKVTANSITANTMFLGSGTGGTITGVSNIETNTLVAINTITTNTIVSSVVTTNTLVTTRITANIWNGLYTANVIESPTNLYYTNARVVSAVTPLLTTANVVETTNQYFTNARVLANVSAMSINVFADVDITGITSNNTLVWNGSAFVAGIPNSLFAERANVANTVLSLGNFSTQDVSFKNLSLTGNLYVLGNLVSVFANTLTISDPIIQLGYDNPGDSYDLGFVGHYNDGVERHTGFFRDHNDGKFKVFDNLTTEPLSNDLDTGNVTFRYATIVASTFEGNVSGTAGSLSNHTTSALAEGTNLYFTNARAVLAVTPLLTTANVIETTNLYFTNARVLANVSEMSINVFADVDMTGLNTDGILVWNGNAFVAGSIQAAAAANVAQFAFTANVANLVLSIGNFTTANLAEGTNLYFSNTRARDALDGQNLSLNNLTANTLTLNNSLTSAVKVTNITSPGEILITKFDINRYRTAEFIYTVIGKGDYSNLYNAGKILLLHDNTDVYFNQYGILLTGNGTELLTFSANINNSNVNLYGQVTGPNVICDVRLSGTTYTEA